VEGAELAVIQEDPELELESYRSQLSIPMRQRKRPLINVEKDVSTQQAIGSEITEQMLRDVAERARNRKIGMRRTATTEQQIINTSNQEP